MKGNYIHTLIIALTWTLFVIHHTNAQPYTQNKNIYVTQLHVHGWSNHNGSNYPGSLQFHNWQANEEDVNMLWWTEHHGMFRQGSYELKFENGVIDPTTSHIEGISAGGSGTHSRWECIHRDLPSAISLSGDTLSVQTGSSSGNTKFNQVSYTPRSVKGLIKELDWTKPIAAEPFLNFMVKPVFQNSADGRLRITVKLSHHYKGGVRQDILIYNFIEGTNNPSRSTNGSDTVWVVYPLTANTWQQVTMDLALDAAVLPDGADNSISDLEISFLSRNGVPFSASIYNIDLVPADADVSSLVQKERNILTDHTALYSVQNILGIELSYSDHLNGFFPASVTDTGIFRGTLSGSTATWVQNVHDEGGIVSYNHMFGTGWNTESSQVQDYREDTMVSYLRSTNCHDADILEVGYLKRGGADLEHHLRVWDRLNASGLFIYGNGVSDSHGGVWMGSDKIFHTYIWAESPQDLHILEGLSKGKMFFGILNNFRGSFYYSIGNLEMGDRGFLNTNEAGMDLLIDPMPHGYEVRITQALIKENTPIEYVYDNQPVSYSDPNIPLELNEPSFIRVAVYSETGEPVLFGQPIIILGNVNDAETAIYHDTSGAEVKVYPNPVKTVLNTQVSIPEDGNYTISILNSLSQEIRIIDSRFFFSGNTAYRIDVHDLATGSYVLQMAGMGRTATSRFVKSGD